MMAATKLPRNPGRPWITSMFCNTIIGKNPRRLAMSRAITVLGTFSSPRNSTGIRFEAERMRARR